MKYSRLIYSSDAKILLSVEVVDWKVFCTSVNKNNKLFVVIPEMLCIITAAAIHCIFFCEKV